MHDVAIIGARCAGSSLALGLAREGLDVVLIDRATFPSDTMSGHFIHPAGVSCLRRMGLLEDLDGLGAPPVAQMTLDFGPVALSGRPAPAADGTGIGYAPRRYVFDPMLADAAVAAGAEFREGVSFAAPIERSGRIVGIRTTTPGGKVDDIETRLVVGADGKRSRFAARVGAATYGTAPAASCCWYAYWEGLPITGGELFIRDGLFAVAAPTNNGLTFLGVAWPRESFAGVRADVALAYHAAAGTIPALADRLASARQVGRFVGTGDTDGFFRAAAGPGWALLGDAGYHKDPITAQGMTDALLHAEILAGTIVEGLGGARPLDEALADFGRRRDALARPIYAMTADMARLAPPPPEMSSLIAALRDDPTGTSRFLGIMAGTVAPGDFLAERACLEPPQAA